MDAQSMDAWSRGDSGAVLDASADAASPVADAGVDAGSDAGTDASLDTGSFASDAGMDVGSDAFDPCTRCDINATCASSTCTCNPGFVGDGITCMPRTLGISAFEGFFKASNTEGDDSFGISLALSEDGSTLAVGAYDEDSSGTGVGSVPNNLSTNSGAVYVYRRVGAGWSFQAFIKASNTGDGDNFGVSVALSADGNTLAVGANSEDSSGRGVGTVSDEGAGNSGAVYVYTRVGAAWSFQAFVKASNTGGGDGFGAAVALSADGDTLAVGAINEDTSGAGVGSPSDEALADSGAAYVFVRAGAVWTFQSFFKASNPGVNDFFGRSVALSGDGNTLAVGAQREGSSGTGVGSVPNEGASESGAVYVYTRVGAGATAWAFQSFVKASNTGAFDIFGWSVALNSDGNTLAVGAMFENSSGTGVGSVPNEGASDSGAVYVYTRVGSTWSFQAFIKASNTGASDRFGVTVALSGDGNVLAVGAVDEASSGVGVGGVPDEGASQSGAVYVYTRAAGAWSQQAFVKASNTGMGDAFGRVALSADGSTLAVGASNEDSSGTGVGSVPNEGAPQSGAVYVYR